MGECQGDGHCDLQSTHGHVDGSIDPAYEFLVVADDQFGRQDSLLVDGELLLEVHDPLPEREQELFFDELALGLVGLDSELFAEPGVDGLSECDLLCERVGEFAHVALVLTEGDVVTLELITPFLEGLDDRVDHGLAGLVLHEVALERRAYARDRPHHSREPAGLEVDGHGIELLHLDTEVGEGPGHGSAVLGAV